MPDDTMTNEPQSAPAASSPTAAATTPPEGFDPRNELMDRVVAALKTCYDPEIPVDIWELGLIYRVDIDPDYNVEIDMTLTSPMCPVAGELPLQVQEAVRSLDDVKDCKVELVWDPPWRQDMMSEVARVALDMF
ncbi:DUF59 domain-containing protein [Azospirillum thermophilum]|uniref:MIP18 family-like domain-containing protein n=1 Tax=Azospirillum thermophilum TaxID=2202148 RepID=A0A2S2CXW0_9PROT|nr:hypothetical protein DEW08_24795 [Azospirillum thermophilum]